MDRVELGQGEVGEGELLHIAGAWAGQLYECDLGPLIRTHVKMRYQETLARFSLTFLVEFCKLLSDLRDRKSHLLDGIKQREHREHREHTQSTVSAAKGAGAWQKFCQTLRSCFLWE